MRNFFSILLIIVLVIMTPVLFIVSSAKYNVVRPKFIKSELVKQNAYTIATEQVSQQLGSIKLDSSVPITSADLQHLGQQVISPQWLQQNVEATLDTTYTWFNAPRGATLSLPLDLRQPKAQLSQGIDDLLTSKISTLPTCPKKGTADGLCKTSTTTLASLKDQLKEHGLDIVSIESQLPDTIDLANPVLPTIQVGDKKQDSQPAQQPQQFDQQGRPINQGQPNQQQFDQQGRPINQGQQNQQQPEQPKLTPTQQAQQVVDHLNKAKDNYQQAMHIYLLVLIGYIVLILGYIAINATTGWRRLTRWMGILGLSIGILPLAIGLGSKTVMEKMLPNIHLDSTMPAALQTAIPSAIRDVQQGLFASIVLVAALLVILGLAAIIGAHYIPTAEPAKK